MNALRSISSLVLGLTLGMAGCGPTGLVTRTIHPPFNLSTVEGHETAAKISSIFHRTRPGLPAHCRLEGRAKDHFCISCDEGGTDIERCHALLDGFDSAGTCVHTTEHIKCLRVTPPFALKIALKGSLERTLVENTRLWQEGLRAIAKPNLSGEQRAALEDGLRHTGQLVELLVKAGKPPLWIEQIFPELAPPLKKSLAALQHEKEAGHLKLNQILPVSRQILESRGVPASLLSYWEALSLEGLEEPGEE